MMAAMLFFFGLAGVGLSYRVIAAWCLYRWLGRGDLRAVEKSAPRGDGVSWLRPCKPGVPRLQEKLAAHAAALRKEDELILGFDENDAAQIAVAEAVKKAHSNARIVVCHCRAGLARNPKINKLLQMSPHAGCERWIICDSEAEVHPDFANALLLEWERSGLDLLTCAYRIGAAQNGWQRLDAASILIQLLPGLAVVRQFGSLTFALGACMAVRRESVERAGGWLAFADRLAEDFHLGQTLSRSGARIGLSRSVVTLSADPLTARAYWRHQRRVAVTYRVCNPIGFAGLGAMQSMAWALIGAMAGAVSHPWLALGGLLIVWGLSVGLTAWTQHLTASNLRGLGWLVPVAGFVETICWAMSWKSNSVFWGERNLRVDGEGTLETKGSTCDPGEAILEIK
jgi:ceramide glucosyltransferase